MASGFATQLLGWKRSPQSKGKDKNKAGWRWVPNSSDVDSDSSLVLGGALLDYLGVQNENSSPSATAPVLPANTGTPLEDMVRDDLAAALPRLDPNRHWEVLRSGRITNYAQYQHLDGITAAIAGDPNLSVTLGRDYLIKPDVTVGLIGTPTLTPHPWLHAAIACKWSIRSDRVQNIRHEAHNMIRHRRGRLPHLVTVTAEPLPSRLASIARGTGEVDVVFHIAYKELEQAVASHGNPLQQDHWEEVTKQGRLRDYNELAQGLVDW
ncbi:hypothetical protein acdb102_15980 [Acidothermaceae bacterium B102]|nr:hypothetical protein acdb102_15980 [Acidothermaceae bacterium B102]